MTVANSYAYDNYRHQADACHAYQLVRANGVPASNIITFLYDDVAHSRANPYPGQLFNAPTDPGTPGVDVYKNMQKDYTGADVNPANFLAVITGNATGVVRTNSTGPATVLQSTADDDVFIFTVGHGGTGFLFFPANKFLYASDLSAALTQMHDTGMYRRLVFYVEACESGSMFQDLLPPGLNVYASTAANAAESSWGTYCPPADMVDGKAINTCLGDLFSVNWMEVSNHTRSTTQSIRQTFSHSIHSFCSWLLVFLFSCRV